MSRTDWDEGERHADACERAEDERLRREGWECEVCETLSRTTRYDPRTKACACSECAALVVTHDRCGTAFYATEDAACDVCGEVTA